MRVLEAVLVPMKAFRHAKVRLAPALAAKERADLVRWMGDKVLAAAAPLPVAVACDDHEVADWARDRGARVIWTPGLGLNGAVMAGVSELAGSGFDWVTVSHGDLPLALDLSELAAEDADVTLVPDQRHEGTNVARVPARSGFRFSYGHGSLRRHVAEAERLGLRLRVLTLPSLAWDVDLPSDLSHIAWLLPASAEASGHGGRR